MGILETIGGRLGVPLYLTLALLGAAVIGGLLSVRFVRRAVMFALSLIPATYLFILWLYAIFMWWAITPLSSWLKRRIGFDRLFAWFLDIPARHGDGALTAGNRKAFAGYIWPKNQYPELYQRAPEDIDRPLFEDGRLLGGHSMRWLADRFFTERSYFSGMSIGIDVAVLYPILTLAVPVYWYGRSLIHIVQVLIGGTPPTVEQWPGDAPVSLSAWLWLWAKMQAAGLELLNLCKSIIHSLTIVSLTATGLALLTGVMVVNYWFRHKTASYRLVTKDADVRWPYRIESRNLARTTYRKQLALATGYLKDKPTYDIGVATGTLRTRGDYTAPTKGQSIKLDRESLFQHIFVFGGTGEGKTTAMLKPLIRQVLQQPEFGAFIADAKGVLWGDAIRVARDIGREKDCILIGTGEGQKGVNIVAGLNPSQVAAALRSVLAQLGNVGGDSFWPDMAAGVLRHMLTLGQGFSKTAEGQKRAANGLSPYSLWWAYQAVLRPDLINEAIQHVQSTHDALIEKIEAAKTDEEAFTYFTEDGDLVPPELTDTIVYLRSAWRKMAPETKTGVIASITQLLDGFAGAPILRKRFASGQDDNVTSVSEALDGKILLNTLSSVEDGLPARLVTILIKTTLYRAARQREAEFKSASPPLSPQDKPCLVVMDEVQELVTVDPSSGLSDGSFWNVARSTGLAGVFATQTIAALMNAMDESPALNFVQQARSKVFFRTEERATAEYACWCAGEFERNRVYDDGHRESIESRQLIDGWDPFVPVNEKEAIPSEPGLFLKISKSLLKSEALTFEALPNQPTYAVDTRFIGGNDAAAVLQSKQAAYWRSEDLTRQYRSQGNEKAPALTGVDLIQMGRWHAFAHIQRAGAARQDIVVIEHDFS